jgi:uncharacterized coiled-coil protein SlyX
VIMNAMDEVRSEQALEDRLARREQGIQHVEDEIAEMHTQLDAIKSQLDFIAFRMKKGTH